jgi:hypothetical protein
MKPTEEVILTHAQEANHNAERAYWWMKGIDREEAQRLGVADMVQSVLSLLQKVDNITIDIQITIKQKSI